MNDTRKPSTEAFSHIEYEVLCDDLFDESHATPRYWCPARPLHIVGEVMEIIGCNAALPGERKLAS